MTLEERLNEVRDELVRLSALQTPYLMTPQEEWDLIYNVCSALEALKEDVKGFEPEEPDGE